MSPILIAILLLLVPSISCYPNLWETDFTLDNTTCFALPFDVALESSGSHNGTLIHDT